jgi:hypothetical protein
MSSIELKNHQLSSCWNDFLSRTLKAQTDGLTTSLLTTTQWVQHRFSINTSVPVVIRCDGRSYIPADSQLDYQTTTIHPPSTSTSVGGFLWTPKPSCLALKLSDCIEGQSAFEAAKTSMISSLYSQYWPLVPTLDAVRSATTVVVARNGGPDGLGGLPPAIEVYGDVMGSGICNVGLPQMEHCPSRKDVENCQLAAAEITVYYWPTSSAGSYCGPKTSIPFPMTKAGEPNTVLIDVSTIGNPIKTIITSPSALLVIPNIRREFLTKHEQGISPDRTHITCGTDFATSATLRVHPSDLSAIEPHFISTAEGWETGNFPNYDTPAYKTQYRQEMTLSPMDFAAVHNPAWLKQYPYDNTASCGPIWNGAIETSVLPTTITEPQVASMKQTNCSMRVLDIYMAPVLAVPKWPLWKQLDREWLNFGEKQAENEEPICKPMNSMAFYVRYIPITAATVTWTELPWQRTAGAPAETVTITSVPPYFT